MVEPVSLALARAHCRLEDDDTANDAVLSSYIAAARGWVEDYTGLTLTSGDVPPVLIQAMLLLIAHWHADREAVGSAAEIAPVLEQLCFRRRKVGL